MPTYEYRCPNGHEFERFFKRMSASATEMPCVECGAPAVRQLSGGAGLVFKGSGFYLTDYGKNAHRGEEAKKKSDAGGDSAKSEVKGDGKKEAAPKPAAADAKPAVAAKSESAKKPKTE